MVTVTLSVPEKLKKKMDRFPELNWSEVARQAFSQRIEDMEFLRRFKERSTMTEKDALVLGRQVRASLGKRLKKTT